MTYNQKRHIELLKRSQDLKNQGKNLFIENPEEGFELSEYDMNVNQHIVWEDRFEIASVMEDFLSKKIDAHEFYDNAFGLRCKNLEKNKKFLSKLVSEEIKDFCPNKDAHKLDGFLTFLYFECEHFEINWDEETFYNSIRNGFLKFQKILNEE